MANSEEVKLFEPSNGTHGDFFMSEFCYRCAKFPHNYDAKKQCSIFIKTQIYRIDEPEYPNQWRYVDGKPVCTAFKDRDEFNAERRSKRKRTIATDKSTLSLF